jgi:hypothetical protein
MILAGFSKTWDDVVTEVKKTINRIIGEFNKLIGKINAIGVDIPWWLGGGRFSLHLPTIKPIPLAKGGIVDSATYAMIGESGKEAVMPLENNTGWMDALAEKLGAKMQLAGGPGGDVYVLLDGQQIASNVERRQSWNKIKSGGR